MVIFQQKNKILNWIAFALLFGSSSMLHAQDTRCNIPSDILNNTQKAANLNIDYQNLDAPVTGFQMVLSWSPEYCQGNPNARLQCQINKFNWVLHGLWPQNQNARNVREHPRFCQNTPVPADIVKQNLCTMPDVKLIHAQWQKHGSCAFKTPDAYFAKSQSLWQNIKKPSFKQNRLNAGEIKTLITDINPNIPRSAIYVKTRGNDYLSEVGICYDTNFKTQACAKNSRGAPDFINIKIR